MTFFPQKWQIIEYYTVFKYRNFEDILAMVLKKLSKHKYFSF